MTSGQTAASPWVDGEQFQLLFDEMLEGFAVHEIIVDADGVPVDYRFLDVNPAFERQTGLVRREIIGRTVREVIPGIEGEWIERYGRVALTSEPVTFTLPASDLGKTYQVRAFSPKPGYFATVFNDVTDYENAARALRTEEETYRELYERSPIGYESLDADGNIIIVNQAWLDVLGYSADEVIGHPFAEFLAPGYAEKFCDLFASFKAAGKTHIEVEMLHKDGTPRFVAFDGRIGLDENGNFKQTHCVMQDLTERHRIEEVRRQIEEQHKSTITDAPIPMMVHAEDGEVIQINNAWQELTGYTPEQIPTVAAWTSLAYGPRSDSMQDNISRLYELTGRISEGEFPIRTATGQERIWEFHSAPMGRTPDGRRLVVSMATDMTDRKEFETELLTSKKRLEQMVLDVVATMGRIVEKRDPYTQGHEVRVAALSSRIAEEMGLPERDIDDIEMAALVHDIGKLAVPAEILTKPGKLSEAEFALIREHPAEGHEILKQIVFPSPVAEIALRHHERMDGSGYPGGLAGDDIPLVARIVAVADVVEAMSSHRPYRPAVGLEAAMDELRACPEKYDPVVVEACLRLYEVGAIRF